MSNPYRLGTAQARINPSDLPPSWHNPIPTFKLMRESLDMYYYGRQMINEVDIYNKPLAVAMRSDLNEAAGKGWKSFGPGDLNDALDYLWERKRDNEVPWWGETDRQTFKGVDVPVAFHGFLTEVHNRGSKINEELRTVNGLFSKAKSQAERDDWHQLTATMATINKTANRLGMMTWMLPEHRATEILNKSRIGATKITDLFDKFDKASRLGFAAFSGDRGDLALNLLGEVVSSAPVLGSLYGSAIEAIPNWVGVVQSVDKIRVERLRRMGVVF